MDTDQIPRYFVVVAATQADDLRALQPLGLDLFAPTARRLKGRAKQPFEIDGLLSQKEIDVLNKKGYSVRVVPRPQDFSAASTGPGTLDIEAWHQHVRALIAKDQAVK